MTRRSGFTLLEILLALVIASVVALLVYGAIQVGVEARDRLAVRLAAAQTRRTMRVVLVEALRNARPPLFLGDNTFAIEQRSNVARRPADRVSFRTAGSLPPLTPDSDWLVTLEATDSGATLWARPAGTRLAPRLVARLPDVTGIEVQAQRGVGPAARWVRDWPHGAALPVAVSITFWTGSAPAPALLMTLPNGGAR